MLMSRRLVTRHAAAYALVAAIATSAVFAPEVAAAQALPDFTELVEKVGPAVVNVRTTERGRANRMPGGGEINEDMLEFFRRFGIPVPTPRGNPRTPQQPQQPDAEESVPRGVGSGFILSADGYVMTNAHVVDGADEVVVTLADKREFKARLIGADKMSDVAIVKIDADRLPFVKIGDVSKIKVGEWAIAIGSPFGLESTVTAGIISAKSRNTGDFLPLIQTDVAINPGNSGGPLINMRGEVIGINSQIYSRSGGYMGISFSIPIDEAIRVADQLRSGGRVVRGRIGVVIGPVSREVAEAIGLGRPTGAFVSQVEADGPAEKAGIEPGDVITRVDGRVVESSVELPRLVAAVKPGGKTTLQVFRKGSYRDLSVGVVERDPVTAANTPRPAASREAPKPQAVTSLGLGVSDLTDAEKRERKVKAGVKVETADGIAARAGLRPGDVILSIGNTDVTSARQFEQLVGKLEKGKPVSVLVRRGEQSNFLVLRPAS